MSIALEVDYDLEIAHLTADELRACNYKLYSLQTSPDTSDFYADIIATTRFELVAQRNKCGSMSMHDLFADHFGPEFFEKSELRCRRELKGLTLTDLARYCSCTSSRLRQLERRHGENTRPTAKLANEIAKHLDCSVDDLFDDVYTGDYP